MKYQMIFNVIFIISLIGFIALVHGRLTIHWTTIMFNSNEIVKLIEECN